MTSSSEKKNVPCSSSKVFVFSVGDMLPCSVVPILLGQSEVDEEQLVTVTADSHEEVVGFNVSVDEVLIIDEFNAANHLVGKH